MKKYIVIFIGFLMLLSSCSPSTQTAKQDNVLQSTTIQSNQEKSSFESLSNSLNKMNIEKILSTAELEYNASDPKTIYERFPEIISAEVIDIGYAMNFNEKKNMFVTPYSPVKLKVIKSWKGEAFKEGEEVTIYAYGGYLKYRDLEKSFDPEDSKAEQTQKSMTESEKDNTVYFNLIDGQTFPEISKKYVFHIYKDDYGDYYTSGHGLCTQEIVDNTILSTGISVNDYFKELR